jgi:hypothetical protein
MRDITHRHRSHNHLHVNAKPPGHLFPDILSPHAATPAFNGATCQSHRSILTIGFCPAARNPPRCRYPCRTIPSFGYAAWKNFTWARKSTRYVGSWARMETSWCANALNVTIALDLICLESCSFLLSCDGDGGSYTTRYARVLRFSAGSVNVHPFQVLRHLFPASALNETTPWRFRIYQPQPHLLCLKSPRQKDKNNSRPSSRKMAAWNSSVRSRASTTMTWPTWATW